MKPKTSVAVFAVAWISLVFGAKLHLQDEGDKLKKCVDVGEEALGDDEVDEPCGNGVIPDAPNECKGKWVRYREQGIICGSINGNCGTVGLCEAPPKPKIPDTFADCLDAKAKHEELAKAASKVKSGMYPFKDGSHHWCDMTTDGGGWTLLMRVNKDYDWIPFYKKNTHANGTKVDFDTANIWHKSHWGGPTLEPGREMDSGISTDPKLIAPYKGTGDWELRFSFYDAEDAMDPVRDGILTLTADKGKKVFDPEPRGEFVSYGSNDFKFRILKNPNGKHWSGNRLCWTCHRSGYEGGLHFGSGGNCHLDNNGHQVMLKSHYGRCNGDCKCTSWYGGHHGFLEHGALQVKHKKIAVWIRRKS